MPYRFAALVLAGALVVTPVPAAAQAPIAWGEAVVPVDEVREIALEYGIRRIDSIELNESTGRWEVDGADAHDAEVEMDIDARTGTIIRIDR